MEGILQRVAAFSAAHFNIRTKEYAAAALEKERRDSFLAEIKELRRQMDALQSCFDLETDFDLIETYTLELCSLERRYSYLIKKAKREKIRAF